ncbi:hypothetical protein O7626_05715 [Micromonospora sp. WMMD1102]|uniref:trypsin-like serine peptidase n=1 Tax=Micromonospora sp. WMMD1102 TaxID=3016105 RepID=UPI0024153CDF|nr:hypothetical protein [Micromonospora sp. WMMD1102]MDG4785433.1 hypothetical protein [Micromonospora sp. WMMD1102]
MRVLAKRASRAASVALALAMAAVPALVLGQPAGAAPAPGLDPGATAEAWAAGRAAYGADVTEHQAIVAYWTPERMRAARPVEESPAYRQAVRQYVESGQTARRTAPDRGARLTIPPAAGELGTPGSGPVPAALNPNFAANHPTARTSGKVFFTMGGGNFVCSGTVINSEGQDTVWTAGHCTHPGGPGGALATNWSFVPAFDDDLANPRPFGTWTAARLIPAPGWTASSNFGEDMAVAIMNTLNGQHIVTRLGGQGLDVNRGMNVAINAFGYPAEAPFDGGNLLRCSGNSQPESPGATQTVRIPCDMTRGSSGGGWLLNWDGNFGFLYGVNSRIDRIVGPTVMMSPFFDNTALNLYNQTRNL